jgi:hypothetical protein
MRPALTTRRWVLLTALAAGALGASLWWGGRPRSNAGDGALVGRTTDGAFTITLVPGPDRRAALERICAWSIVVTDPRGAPVARAEVSFDALMPEHGHGLPTAPVVRESSEGQGRYDLLGLRFSMDGHWLARVRVKTDSAVSTAEIPIVL